MASKNSIAKISYQRLRNEDLGFDEVEDNIGYAVERRTRGVGRWSRRYRRVHIRRKLKIKIPSLKKFLRRKTKVVVASLSKVIKRLKESQSHFGDLFAGNYLFMQVTPTSLKYLDKSSKPNHFRDFSSAAYYLPKVSLN